jgi:predicted  nucleic acid-binding Zn-ribbon protein
MFEVIVGLSCLTLIFLVTSIMAGNRYLSLQHENRKLEQMNADLRYSVKHLKTENEKLRNGVYVTPDTERITALKFSLHLKQEKIFELQEKIRKQQQLLNQKWEGCKK